MAALSRIVVALAVLVLGTEAALADKSNVQVFALPEGTHPHDVAPAPDGTVWYTAQAAGALGILDPRTGKSRQVPLGDGSAPHGVIAGPDGAAWITDGGLNAIVRFDPATQKLTKFPLPADAEDANLNTAAFDGKGRLWFTGQGGFYGRLDPGSGAMRVFKAPRGSGPYGITATPDGTVWYASLAGSYIARLDGESGAATVIDPPGKDDGPRRIWSDKSGNLWVSLWNAGALARYTPATGQWKAWPLPGKGAHAYAVYVDERGVVWVSNFGANAVLSFDPKSETFFAYPGSAADAEVRQILGRPGEIWLPESGLDRLMLIRTAPRTAD